MSYEPQLAAVWLATVLGGDATLHALAPGGVWEDSAPSEVNGVEVAYPFTVFTWMGGSDLLNMVDRRIWSDELWRVYAIGVRGRSDANLGAAASRIDALLNLVSGDVRTAHVYTCSRRGPWRRPSTDNGITFREMGGIYRLKIQDPVGG